MPSVNVNISTSSPILNIKSKEPFTITLDIFLDHTCPITFKDEDSNIFNGKFTYQGGLTLTEIPNREPIDLRWIDMLRESNNGVLHQSNQKDFTTFYPGEKFTFSEAISGTEWNFLAPDAKKDPVGGQEKSRIRKYEIGIDAKAAIRSWLEGDKEELLAKPIAQRCFNSRNNTPISFDVVQPAQLTVEF